MKPSDVNYIWRSWILSDPGHFLEENKKKTSEFAVSSTLLHTLTAGSKQQIMYLEMMCFCSQVRDGAMSDLQTQLREVLRENELLRRDVSKASNII